MYGDVAMVAVGGGAVLGGFALVRMSGPAATVAGLLIAAVAALLTYRSLRLRWARRRAD